MYRKTIAAALATLSLAAVAAPAAQAGIKPTLQHQTYPYRSGHMTRVLFGHHTYRILLSTWS